MELTDRQRDALAELINIAFDRAAASLSETTGRHVLLEASQVAICPINELPATLSGFAPGEIATVHQVFGGAVAGDALLLLNYASAVALSNLLVENHPRVRHLDASAREVLTEVGNILLNHCLGSFGNILQVQPSLAVPRIHLAEIQSLLDSLVIGGDEVRYGLIVNTNFCLRESAVDGCLVIALGMTSLERLLLAAEKMG